MGLLDWAKKARRKENNLQTKPEDPIITSQPQNIPIMQDSKIISSIKSPMFKIISITQLQPESTPSWEDLFIKGKATEKLPGFDLRSKNKAKLHYYDNDSLVIELNKELYIIRSNIIKKISLKQGFSENMHVSEARKDYAIATEDNRIIYFNLKSCSATIFEFAWHPFRILGGDNFWLVSTRETTEGPGELYCFSLNAQYLWGLQLMEEFETPFGVVKATGYHLGISKDNKQILVSTMDRIYRLTQNGTLISRIALSDLREAEIKIGEANRRAKLPKNPKTKEEIIEILAHEMSEQLVGGMIRTASLHSPFAGLVLDPKTNNVFLLEGEGRLTSWDPQGNLIWVYSFNEEGYYINWIDDSIIVSFRTGNTVWLDQNGITLLSAKLPKQAKSIFCIPEQDKYLIVCEDDRRYELDKLTGELIQGPEGDKRMALFSFQERMVFYDGYLWAAPIGHSWEAYRPKKTEYAALTANTSLDDPAPQVKISKSFKKAWTLSSIENSPIRYYTVDKRNHRIYVGKRKKELSQKEEALERKAWESNSFARWNEVVCYDFSLKPAWSISFLSELTLVATSPQGDAVFIGLWHQGLSYDPGKLVVVDSNGYKKLETTTAANPVALCFTDPNQGILEIYRGNPYSIKRNDSLKWEIEQNSEQIEAANIGLNEIILGNYRIIRTDKKVYQVSYMGVESDLKLSAAIYEAILSRTGNLILRIGNKTIKAFTAQIKPLWSIKTETNIKSVIKAVEGFLVLSKEEILYYNWEGKLIWRLGCPPNSDYNIAAWLDTRNTFIWGAGDRTYFQVCLISEGGRIIKSQLFKELSVYYSHSQIDIVEDKGYFILHIANSIECYEI